MKSFNKEFNLLIIIEEFFSKGIMEHVMLSYDLNWGDPAAYYLPTSMPKGQKSHWTSLEEIILFYAHLLKAIGGN